MVRVNCQNGDGGGSWVGDISLSSELWGTENTAMQIGGVLQNKLEVYFDTLLRSSVVGVSGILLVEDSSCDPV